MSRRLTAITSTFIEAVIAPAVDDAARRMLAKKINMRVVIVDFDVLRAATTPEVRSILGAILVQQRDIVSEAYSDWPGSGNLRVVTRRQPTDRGMAGHALCLARVRPRQVERRDLHRRTIARWRSAPVR